MSLLSSVPEPRGVGLRDDTRCPQLKADYEVPVAGDPAPTITRAILPCAALTGSAPLPAQCSSGFPSCALPRAPPRGCKLVCRDACTLPGGSHTAHTPRGEGVPLGGGEPTVQEAFPAGREHRRETLWGHLLPSRVARPGTAQRPAGGRAGGPWKQGSSPVGGSPTCEAEGRSSDILSWGPFSPTTSQVSSGSGAATHQTTTEGTLPRREPEPPGHGRGGCPLPPVTGEARHRDTRARPQLPCGVRAPVAGQTPLEGRGRPLRERAGLQARAFRAAPAAGTWERARRPRSKETLEQRGGGQPSPVAEGMGGLSCRHSPVNSHEFSSQEEIPRP